MEAGMPQQDQHGFSEISTNLQYLRAIKQLLLDDIGRSKLAFKSDCGWSPKSLAYAAILWAWADPNTLRDRFTIANKIACRLFRLAPVTCSYQSFVKLLVRHTDRLVEPIVASLQHRMQCELKSKMQIGGRDVLAVDGTKVLLPKSRSNEKAYAKTRKRKQTRTDVGAKTESGHLRNRVPQFYITMLWSVGTGMLYRDALELAGRTKQRERDRAPRRNDRRSARAISGRCRRRLHRLRPLAISHGRRTRLSDSRWREREAAKEPRFLPRIRLHSAVLAEGQTQMWSAATGLSLGKN